MFNANKALSDMIVNTGPTPIRIRPRIIKAAILNVDVFIISLCCLEKEPGINRVLLLIICYYFDSSER